MEQIKVWTKQHKNVLEELKKTGRYTAKRQYIAMDMQEHADLVLEAYDWLVKHGPDAGNRPPDADYPVWVSFQSEATMLPSEGTVKMCIRDSSRALAAKNTARMGSHQGFWYRSPSLGGL